MAYVANGYTPIRSKEEIRWLQNGEEGNQEILNRPIDDVANMVLTVVNESMSAKKSVRLCNYGNLSFAEYSEPSLKGYKPTGDFVANTTKTSAVVTLSPGIANTIMVGASISGTGIPLNTTVISVNSATEIVLSKPSTQTIVDITLTYTQVIDLKFVDGIRINTGDRILLKDQLIPSQNGIYDVINKGTDIDQWILTRSTDGAEWNQFVSSMTPVDEGTKNKDTVWLCNSNLNAGTIGSNGLTFVRLNKGSGQMYGEEDVKMFSYNSRVLNENIVVEAGVNSSAAGPITIPDGYTVTVNDGARLIIY